MSDELTERTLLLSAKLYRGESGDVTVELTDGASGQTEEHPVPQQYAAMLPQLLAQLR
ncbi:hypothetical protein AB0A70_06800 [Streptomyces morookaense]|uniref:hypothetical protein n=1 Tax=Streptomyces morookaense TaxID=1970 RepID=UPI0033C89FE1